MDQIRFAYTELLPPFAALGGQQVPPSAFRQSDKSLVSDALLRDLFSPALKARKLSRPNRNLSSNRVLLSNHPC